MKALLVKKDKVVIEVSIEYLYIIFNSLNYVVDQYEQLDLEILDRAKEAVDEVLEEVTNLLAGITDDEGNAIPTS